MSTNDALSLDDVSTVTTVLLLSQRAPHAALNGNSTILSTLKVRIGNKAANILRQHYCTANGYILLLRALMSTNDALSLDDVSTVATVLLLSQRAPHAALNGNNTVKYTLIVSIRYKSTNVFR